jgi:protein-S-isoprenylcysteine O-methyltransferase Ste14
VIRYFHSYQIVMTTTTLCILVGWLVFYVSHSFLAADVVKKKVLRFSKKIYRMYRVCYNLISLAAVGFLVYATINVDESVWLMQQSMMTIGILLIMMGIAIVSFSIQKYSPLEFAGITQLKDKISKPAPSKLIVTGLNKYVRHPLYFGLLLIFAGWFFLQPTLLLLLFNGLTLIYLIIGSRLEEKKLEVEFGNDYRIYATRVKSLIPFVL